MRIMVRLAKDRRGAGTVEYALLATMMALGTISAVSSIGKAATKLEGMITVGFTAAPAAGSDQSKTRTESDARSDGRRTGNSVMWHVNPDGTITSSTR